MSGLGIAPLNTPQIDWRGKRVWIVGGSTGIGHALASALHAQGAQVFLSARGVAALEAFVQTHPGSHSLPVDAVDPAALQAATNSILAGGVLDCVVYCAGYYRALRATAYDQGEMLRHLQVNYVGALNLLDAVLPHLLAQGHGHLSLVSSVAGFRGLPKSLAYGPTKAALINLAETLYLDLHPRGIGVSVINPGFVATPLTSGNDFEMPELITPAQAAQAIIAGWRKGRFEVRFPWRFTTAMKVLRLLPYGLYFRAIRGATGL